MADGLAELAAVLGLDVETKQWEGAMELIESTKGALKGMVDQAQKRLPPPKIPLTDEQEALKILERRAKQQRVNAELEKLAPKQQEAKHKAVLTDEQEAQRIIDRRAKQARIQAELEKISPKATKAPKAPKVELTADEEARKRLQAQARADEVGDALDKIKRGSGLNLIIDPWEILRDTLRGVRDVAREAFDAIKHMANEAIEDASKIHDMAEQTGFSTDALQEMKYAAEQSGSSLEGLVAGAKRLNITIEQVAKTGKGPAADALRKLGLTASAVQKSIKTGGLDAGITLVSEKLKTIKDPAEKSRIAMALLGKSGQNLIPTLNDLADLREDARGLGMILAEEDIDAMEDFGDQIGRVKGALHGIRDEVVAALIPALKGVTDRMIKWIGANRELIAENLEHAAEAIGEAIGEAGEILESTFTWIKENKTEIIDFFKGLYHAIRDVVSVVTTLRDLFNSLDAFLKSWELIRDTVRDLSDKPDDASNAVVNSFRQQQIIGKGGSPSTALASAAGPPPGGWMAGMLNAAGSGPTAAPVVNIDTINVNSQSADPKQVASAIGPAFQQLMDQQMRAARR